MGHEDDTTEFSLVDETVRNDLDPHLQEAILAAETPRGLDPALAQAGDTEGGDGAKRIDVICVLKDPEGEVPPGLLNIWRVGEVVTGSVELDQVEAIRAHPNVQSLKGAVEVRGELDFSVGEIEARHEDLAGVASPTDGSGVIIGIVDFGFDFVHHNLRRADGTTRLLWLWDQRGGPSSSSPKGHFGYGREFAATDINAALASADPYQTLAYDPGVQSHGTHVSDIAAGNGRATGRPGVAPAAELIVVHLHGEDFERNESFGNSKTLLEAVGYIFERASALGRAAVVNLSLGTQGGPHDGSTPAERGFERLLDTPGRAIVIAAGNSWEQASHASGTVDPATPFRLGWQHLPGDHTTNELELWYPKGGELTVTLITPSGGRIGPVGPRETKSIQRAGVKVGSIVSRVGDSANGDNHINIVLEGDLQDGVWTLELSTVASAVAFHAWIERDDRGQSLFTQPDSACTLGSISCGPRTITVGSYMATVPGRDISSFSAEGPTRTGGQKPELSAPGDRVLAAASRTQGATRKSGTSMAAPHVTGLLALLMGALGTGVGIADLRQCLLSSVRRAPPAGNGWEPRYGFGRVSGRAALQSALGAAQPAPTIAVSAMVPTLPESGLRDALLASLAGLARETNSRIRIEIEVEPRA